jgi:hypothetical protein
MNIPKCGAAGYLGVRGPAVVPFRMCCVLAILGAPEPLVCDAAAVTSPEAMFWPESEPTVREPAR